MAIAIGVVAVLVLAVVAVLVVGRRSTTTGRLSRETVKRDHSSVEPEAKPADVTVKPGIEPFTYETSDGSGTYLTTVDGDVKSCDCGPAGKDGTCHHVAAVQVYYAKELWPA